MTGGDELLIAHEDLPEGVDTGSVVHLRLSDTEGRPQRCALFIREMGPQEALCEVLAVEPEKGHQGV